MSATPMPSKSSRPAKICPAPGCGLPYTTGGRYCAKHYGRLRNTGYLELPFERGEQWCQDCGKFLPFSEFYIRKSGENAGKPTGNRCKIHSVQHARRVKARLNFGVDYDALLALQDGACAICGTTDPGRGSFHIDHDHSCCSGERSCGECVRGLLCVRCNVGIAMFQDDPEKMEKAVVYIQSRASAG